MSKSTSRSSLLFSLFPRWHKFTFHPLHWNEATRNKLHKIGNKKQIGPDHLTQKWWPGHFFVGRSIQKLNQGWWSLGARARLELNPVSDQVIYQSNMFHILKSQRRMPYVWWQCMYFVGNPAIQIVFFMRFEVTAPEPNKCYLSIQQAVTHPSTNKAKPCCTWGEVSPIHTPWRIDW